MPLLSLFTPPGEKSNKFIFTIKADLHTWCMCQIYRDGFRLLLLTVNFDQLDL